MRDYVRIYVPIIDQSQLTSKEISWGEAQQRSFKELKATLVITPILNILDPKEQFALETHANGEAIGVVIMQGGCRIAFESKKLDCM